MAEFNTVSTLARRWGIQPRDISDAFYARVLNDAECPIIAGRRLIPETYVPTVERVLRERGVLSGDHAEAVPCK